jgi:hypothetical protein
VKPFRAAALSALIALVAPAGAGPQSAPAAPAPRLFAVVFKTGPAWDKALAPSQQKDVHAWSTFAPGCIERAPAPSASPSAPPPDR